MTDFKPVNQGVKRGEMHVICASNRHGKTLAVAKTTQGRMVYMPDVYFDVQDGVVVGLTLTNPGFWKKEDDNEGTPQNE